MGTEPLAPAAPAAFLRARTYLLLCVVVAVALRWPLLGKSLWFDEACMSSQRIGTTEQLLATLYVDIHPPLFVAFMHFWARLFGDGELALRLPALLAGLLSIPALWWTGHRLVGDVAARWGALLLALSPVHVWYSVEARLYAPMVLLTLLAFGTTERLCDERHPRPRWLWWLHVLNAATMLGLHYYLAIVVVALAALAPVLARGFTPMARRLVLWHGVLVLLLGGFVLAKQALGQFETQQDYLRTLTVGELGHFVLGWCWAGDTMAPLGGAWRAAAWALEGLGAVLLLLGLGAVLRAADRGRALLVPIGLLLLPLFLLVLAALGYGRTYMERSVIPALPFVLLLAGAGLASLPRLLQRLAGGATLALATAALASLFLHHERHWLVYKPNGDWRGAAKWLGQEIESGGAGRAVFTPTPNARPLCYYDPRIQDVKNLALPRDPAQLGQSVGKRLGSWLGGLAEDTFRRFAAHNEALLAGSRLRVYRSAADPSQLQLRERSVDDVCYLVRDHWHPHESVDSTVETLLQNPRVQVLAKADFVGITVHKIRILP
jgi:4-amino-4-deoxy-L-arabinose transferase-like glycosyltransferase